MKVTVYANGVTTTAAVVRVVLSRRNLRALLAKLDKPGSACSIYQSRGFRSAGIEVHAEEDAPHYGERVPGAMSDKTEATLRGDAK